MAEVVAHSGVQREKGFLYYLDKEGDISRTKMGRGKTNESAAEKIKVLGIKREDGFLYFIDKQGNVARSPKGKRNG